MVTIKQLKEQIARERARKNALKTRIDLEVEKANLQLELKKLQRKPGTLRNIALAKRTGRGLKIIGKKTFKAVKKQALLIKDQQLRDQALARRDIRRAGKKIGKKSRKRFKKIIKESSPDFFSGLGGLDF